MPVEAKTSRRPWRSTVDWMLLIAGIAYWSHANLLFSYSSGEPSGLPIAASGTVLFFALFGNLLALALMALAPLKERRFTDGPQWIIVSCLFILSGAILLLLIRGNSMSYDHLWLATLLGGLGEGMAFVFFAELFSRIPLQRILLYAGAQQSFAALLYLTLSFFSLEIVSTVIILLVVIQSLLLIKMSGRPPVEERPKVKVPWLNAKDAFPILAVAALFVGLCYGTTLSLVLGDSAPKLPSSNVLGALVGGMLLIASALLFTKKRPEEYLYQVTIPLLALGLVTIPLLTSGVPTAFPILLACSTYLFGLLWFFIALVRPSPQAATGHLAAASSFCFFLGHFSGRAFIDFAPEPLRNASVISSVLLFAIVVLLVFYFSKFKSYERAIIARAEELDFELGCDTVARAYRLTQREQEIFRLLALGFSAKKTAARLVLSENTVNTHIHHIYSKLDIHSREELDRVLETETQKALSIR
jgi:DNA-binding CsgD family transcriptional regulator